MQQKKKKRREKPIQTTVLSDESVLSGKKKPTNRSILNPKQIPSLNANTHWLLLSYGSAMNLLLVSSTILWHFSLHMDFPWFTENMQAKMETMMIEVED